MEKVRIGFIGCGGFSTGAVYPSLHHAPVDLVAVCDLDEAKAKRNAKWFGADRFYFAIHHFDLVRHFMGDFETVYAARDLTNNQASFAVSLKFKSGAVGGMHLSSQQLWGERKAEGGRRKERIYGSF